MANIINWYRFGFARIDSDYQIEIIERSLTPLGEAVAQCAETIDQATAFGDDRHLDAVIDDETAIVENLLGTAFVVCQSYITFVWSRVKSLHRSCHEADITLTTTDNTKAGIMRLGSQLVPQTQYTEVQVIDAFANYFKHHEEWNGRWEQLPNPAARTVPILAATGATQFSTGNFRTAAKKLGNESYSNVRAFSNILRSWGQEVRKQYDLELGSKGLL